MTTSLVFVWLQVPWGMPGEFSPIILIRDLEEDLMLINCTDTIKCVEMIEAI